jgi:peptide/nickel transport system permease protein
MSEAVVPHQAEQGAPRSRSLLGGWFARAIESDVFYSFRRSRLTMVAAAMTALFFLLAILAPGFCRAEPVRSGTASTDEFADRAAVDR